MQEAIPDSDLPIYGVNAADTSVPTSANMIPDPPERMKRHQRRNLVRHALALYTGMLRSYQKAPWLKRGGRPVTGGPLGACGASGIGIESVRTNRPFVRLLSSS